MRTAPIASRQNTFTVAKNELQQNTQTGRNLFRSGDGFDTPTPQKVALQDPQQKTFPPVPAEWKYPGGGYRTSTRDMEGLLERGFKDGGFEQGVAWVQEAYGLKIDGAFGKGTYTALKDEPTLIKMLRDQRIAETPNAMKSPLKPMSAAVKEKLKEELTQVRDAGLTKTGDNQRGYEAAVEKLQEYLVRSGEPMMIDGKAGKGTYESMVRLWGRQTADEVSKHLMVLKSPDNNDC